MGEKGKRGGHERPESGTTPAGRPLPTSCRKDNRGRQQVRCKVRSISACWTPVTVPVS